MRKTIVGWMMFVFAFSTCAAADWPTLAANPQRTSWTPEEVRGRLAPINKNGELEPLWAYVVDPYISRKVQLIAVKDTIYVSTARGVLAIDSRTGEQRWFYATELPTGHSPSVHDGVLYVGCFDRKIHAVDASTGKGLWTFEAGKGFHVNPLVVDVPNAGPRVYAGNRDSFFYCLDAKTGSLLWKFETGADITFSAAYHDGKVFFAANDSHAYALDAATGELLWKSAKLPGHGFRSYWPVVYRNRVIFAGTNNYRFGILAPFKADKMCQTGWNALQAWETYGDTGPEEYWQLSAEEQEKRMPRGKMNGTLREDGWLDVTPVMEFYKKYPWRKSFFVLDKESGEEREQAPILFCGTKGVANRYPPVVAADGLLYAFSAWLFGGIPMGGLVGWQIGTPLVCRTPRQIYYAMDECIAYSIGGNVMHWIHHNGESCGAFLVKDPPMREKELANAGGGAAASTDSIWTYWYIGQSDTVRMLRAAGKLPADYKGYRFASSVYSADQNPLIPFDGRLYFHSQNMVLCFGKRSEQAQSE